MSAQLEFRLQIALLDTAQLGKVGGPGGPRMRSTLSDRTSALRRKLRPSQKDRDKKLDAAPDEPPVELPAERGADNQKGHHRM